MKLTKEETYKIGKLKFTYRFAFLSSSLDLISVEMLKQFVLDVAASLPICSSPALWLMRCFRLPRLCSGFGSYSVDAKGKKKKCEIDQQVVSQSSLCRCGCRRKKCDTNGLQITNVIQMQHIFDIAQIVSLNQFTKSYLYRNHVATQILATNDRKSAEYF